MSAVAAILALILVSLAAIHVYWGLGGVWPGHDERSCARAIAGFRGIERMPPPAASFAVAAALAACALIAAGLAGWRPVPVPLPVLAAGGAGAAAVFLGRGLAGFTPAWRRLTPEMPFARNDRRWFSPLCLAIGTGFAILSIRGFAP